MCFLKHCLLLYLPRQSFYYVFPFKKLGEGEGEMIKDVYWKRQEGI